jgi:hypothetical protein
MASAALARDGEEARRTGRILTVICPSSDLANKIVNHGSHE